MVISRWNWSERNNAPYTQESEFTRLTWCGIFAEAVQKGCITSGLYAHNPLNYILRNKTEYAKRKYKEKDKGAEATGIRLTREVPDDKKHEAYEKGQSPGESKFGNLFFWNHVDTTAYRR